MNLSRTTQKLRWICVKVDELTTLVDAMGKQNAALCAMAAEPSNR